MSFRKNTIPVLCIATLALLLVACRPEGARLHFSISEHFEGPIKIRESTAAAALSKNASGEYVVAVPQTGIVEVKDAAPLKHMSLPGRATFQSGTELKWEALLDGQSKEGEGEIRFRVLGADASGWFHFFVGNKRQADEYWSKATGDRTRQ